MNGGGTSRLSNRTHSHFDLGAPPGSCPPSELCLSLPASPRYTGHAFAPYGTPKLWTGHQGKLGAAHFGFHLKMCEPSGCAYLPCAASFCRIAFRAWSAMKCESRSCCLNWPSRPAASSSWLSVLLSWTDRCCQPFENCMSAPASSCDPFWAYHRTPCLRFGADHERQALPLLSTTVCVCASTYTSQANSE